jgi:translation initiation factor 5A
MAEEEETFEVANAGAALVYPVEAGQIRKGGHIVIKGHPCKVVDTATSKTGKHGHAKVTFVAIDIFTGKKYEDMSPSTHSVEVPVVKRLEATLISLEADRTTSLMLDDGTTREDLDLPEEFVAEAKKYLDEDGEAIVTITKAMDHEQIMAVKKTTSQK